MNPKLPIIIFSLLLTSCVFHSGNISTGAASDCPYRETVEGRAKTVKIFGIGGLQKDALIKEAKQKVYQANQAGKGVYFSNFAVDYKTTIIFFYWKTEAIVSADIFDCNPAQLKEGTKLYFGLKQGDTVLYNFDGYVKGTIEEIKPQKALISFKYRSKSKTKEVKYSELFKSNHEEMNKQEFGFTIGDIVKYKPTEEDFMKLDIATVTGLNKEKILIKYIRKDNLYYRKAVKKEELHLQ